MCIELGESDEGSKKLDELLEQLGELDEDGHETRRVEEQLGESDEFNQGYGCVYTRRVARRKLDGWP